MSQDGRISAIGSEQVEQNANRGGFAGPVEAEKAQDFALDRFQIQIIDGENVSIPFRQSSNGNWRHTCILVLARRSVRPP
jgi:hypothetical protein